MSAKQKGSSTSTQETSFPSWVTDSQQGYDAWRDRYFQDYAGGGGSPVAPLTGAQRRAGDYYWALAEENTPNYAQSIMDAGNPVTGAAIKDGMNPFMDTVGRQVLTDMQREKDDASAQIGARSANAVAFGGSGPALERAQLERSHGQNVERAMTSLLSSGYDRAQALAEGNANRRLSASTAASSAATDAYNRRMGAVDSLLRYGTLEQAQEQAKADRIRSLIDWYGSAIPQPGGSTSQTDPLYFNPIETILGIGLTGSQIKKNWN